MTSKLREEWSIYEIYRGCTTVQSYSTRFRGSAGPNFYRKRDAVAWINSPEASKYEHALTAEHVFEVKLAPGYTDRFRYYCSCNSFSLVKHRIRADAEAEGHMHVRRATAGRR